MTRSLRVTIPLAIITALTLVVTACQTVPPPPRTVGSSNARGTLPASAGTYFGTFALPTGGPVGEKATLAAEERFLGRKLDIAHWFYKWNGKFPSWREPYHISQGRIPMISWGGTDTRSIVNGSQDGLIRARADGVRNLRRPVLMRWFWEMDGNTNRYKAGDPATFKAAWKRIVTIFRSRGASNAAFVWCPNAWGFDIKRAQQMYPEPNTVDWICADAYNWYPKKRGSTWTSFEQNFRSWYAWGASKGKPLMIGEVGAQEDPRSAGRKAQWIRDMGTTLRYRMPKVRAVLYFDHRTTSYSEPGTYYDWRLKSSASAHSAWRNMGLSRFFRPLHR